MLVDQSSRSDCQLVPNAVDLAVGLAVDDYIHTANIVYVYVYSVKDDRWNVPRREPYNAHEIAIHAGTR